MHVSLQSPPSGYITKYSSFVILGNFMNIPKTVARRYQLKDHSDRPLDTGIEIKICKGDSIVVDTCQVSGEPIFGLVDDYSDDGESYICRLYVTNFVGHYHAYKVQYIERTLVIVPRNHLVYKKPVGRVKTKQNVQYLCLRHSVI